MVRIIIPAVLVLCASLAPAAETAAPAVPADAPAATCPLGKDPGSCQGKGREAGMGCCQRERRRDGSGTCQGQGKGQGKGLGRGQGLHRRDGSCLIAPADG
jgi:hypothetical protein